VHAHVQRLVSVVKMATVLEVYTTEEQRYLSSFLCTEGLNTEDIHNKMFSVYGGKCLSRKVVQPCPKETCSQVISGICACVCVCVCGWMGVGIEHTTFTPAIITPMRHHLSRSHLALDQNRFLPNPLSVSIH
jgi:hypothetical protein